MLDIGELKYRGLACDLAKYNMYFIHGLTISAQTLYFSELIKCLVIIVYSKTSIYLGPDQNLEIPFFE